MRASSILFLIIALFTFLGLPSYAKETDETVSTLRKKIFGDEKWQSKACEVVSKGLKDELKGVDEKLHQFIGSIIEDHKEINLAAFKNKFHPRLGMTEKTLKSVFDDIALTYGRPTSFTIYRIWALNTVDGSPDLLPCFEDRLAIGSHYGYPLQFGVWIQVMGESELGRIFASVVPARDIGWRIGAWHLQQWTHKTKDPQKWVEEALEDFEKKAILPAYVKLDIASKLLDGGGYVYPMFLEDVKVTKESYLNGMTFEKLVQSIIGSKAKIAYLSSIFARDGAGLLVRFEVAKDATVQQTRELCEAATAKLHAHAKEVHLGGIKCSFVVPGESKDKDGRLGSIFIPSVQARKLIVQIDKASENSKSTTKVEKKD